MIEHYFESIPGNFTFEELYSYLATVGPRGVEIGVANGRSAAYLGVEMARQPSLSMPMLTLVDNSNGNLYAAVTQLQRLKEEIVVQAIQGDSGQVAHVIGDGTQDFVFIDGDHSYEGAKRDIDAWRSKVRPGGILAGHDYVIADWSGVIQAVNESFERYEVWRGEKWHDGNRYPSWLVRM
jgi:predicted O-methyltransferase YrrM